ncbi:MAG: protein-glutamate O-methyltransferase CheR [Chlamydiia bacterium]|nr:protein-glutamate O-methyltransferase CheR [Chlamydiia bacterium]
MSSISDASLAAIVSMFQGETGVQFSEGKKYLLTARLSPLLRRHHLETYEAFIDALKIKSPIGLWEEFIDALTTHETSFFRDRKPFETISKVLLPDLVKRNVPAVNAWCPACSTGQEAYSLAICMHQALGPAWNYRIKVNASDVSHEPIAYAKRALYTDVEISRGISPEIQNLYLKKTSEGWAVRGDIRACCRFLQENLLKLTPSASKYDLILCRNVAIYFSPEDRKRMFTSLAERLVPGGVLITGTAEDASQYNSAFTRFSHHTSLYYQLKTH